MIFKIFSAATIAGGVILGAVGVSAHPETGTQVVNARIADVRSGGYQRRLDCAADPTCTDAAILSGAK